MSGASNARRIRALWSTLFWSSLGIGSYVVGVQSTFGQEAEASVLQAARFTTDPPAPLNLVSAASVSIALIGIGVLAGVVHGIARAAAVVTLSAFAIMASQLLKLRLLDRPELFELDVANTFPSGHMTVFVVIVAALIWAVPTRLSAITAITGAALLSVVSWQLLAYGWHRPSDLLGAIALGTAAFALAILIRPSAIRGTPYFLRTVSIGTALLSLILIAGAVVVSIVALTMTSQGLLLNAGQFGVIGVSVLASRSLLRLST